MRFLLFDAVFDALRREPSGLAFGGLLEEVGANPKSLHLTLSRMTTAGVILQPRLRGPYLLPPIAHHPRSL